MNDTAPSSDEEMEDLRKQVLDSSQYFTSMLQLIPTRAYLELNPDSGATNRNKKKKQTADQKQNKKLLQKKSKLLKLDPTQHKSIEELQKEVEEKEQAMFEEDAYSKDSAKAVCVSECPSESIEELRLRLQNKMSQLRGKRKILHGDEKSQAKQARLDKHEGEKAKRQKQKQTDSIQRVSKTVDFANKPTVTKEDGSVVFSKFDFAHDTQVGKHKTEKKKDMKKLLEKAEKHQVKLKELKEQGDEKGKATLEKVAWDKATKKAEGEKIKDDPKLLKKAIKRKEKLKQKSSKEWKDRLDSVEKRIDDKQKNRKENLKKRSEGKKHPVSGKANKDNKKNNNNNKGGGAKADAKKKKKHKPGF